MGNLIFQIVYSTDFRINALIYAYSGPLEENITPR